MKKDATELSQRCSHQALVGVHVTVTLLSPFLILAHRPTHIHPRRSFLLIDTDNGRMNEQQRKKYGSGAFLGNWGRCLGILIRNLKW